MRVRLSLFGLVVGVVASVVLSSPSSAEDGPQRPGTWYPGLPYSECRPIAWDPGTCESVPNIQEDYGNLNVMQTGMTGSVKAKQWAPVPIALLAATAGFRTMDNDQGGTTSTTDVWAHFVSPGGSENNYGQSPLIPVRTVAFGAVPATIVLQVDQRRDANNFPIPFYLHIENRGVVRPVPQDQFPSVTFDAVVDVRVRSLVVDGVDTRITGRCRASNARIETASEPLVFPVGQDYQSPPSIADFDPAKGFVGLQGGTLNGSISLPSFSGCTTSTGDDLSRLLTSAISERSNPISLRIGSLNCQFYEEGTGRTIPPAPGTTPKQLGPKCPVYEPYVINPKIQPVPAQLPVPSTAPTAPR